MSDTYKLNYSGAEIDQKLGEIAGKQDKLTAGANIQITNNVISATDTTYTAGENITITNNVISATGGASVPGIAQGTGTGSLLFNNTTNNTALGTNAIDEGNSTVKAPDSVASMTDAQIIADWEVRGDNKYSLAKGAQAHSEGSNNLALGKNSHAEGNGTVASASAAHSEGTGSRATGKYSHAGGLETIASGNESFAHGSNVIASGVDAVAFGHNNEDMTETVNAGGDRSFTSGLNTVALGGAAQAFGKNTYASGAAQMAVGQFNEGIPDYNEPSHDASFIVGNGTSNANKSNSFVVYKDGHAKVSGNLQAAGLTDGTTTKTMTEILAGGGANPTIIGSTPTKHLSDLSEIAVGWSEPGTKTVTWDGDTTSRQYKIYNGNTYYKISDDSPTYDNLIGGEVDEWYNGSFYSTKTITNSNLYDNTSTDGIIYFNPGRDDPYHRIIVIKDSDKAGKPIGIYACYPEPNDYAKEVRYAGGTTYHKIPSEYVNNPSIVSSSPAKDLLSLDNVAVGWSEPNTKTVSWDGDTTGKESIGYDGGTFYKVSDDVPTSSDLIGGKMGWYNWGPSEEYEITSIQDITASGLLVPQSLDEGMGYLFVVVYDSAQAGGKPTGIYLRWRIANVYCSYITYSGGTIYHKIPSEYLPIPAAPTTDGTYTLQVVVSGGVPTYSWVTA